VRNNSHSSASMSASKVVISFPVSGSTEMLGYQASTFSISGSYATVSAGSDVVEVLERTLDADVIRSHISRVQEDVDRPS